MPNLYNNQHNHPANVKLLTVNLDVNDKFRQKGNHKY